MQREPVPYLLTSIEGFVQYVSTALLPHGYVFFVTARIPPGKDPLVIDKKLIERYGCNPSRWTKAKQKAGGIATTRYLRFEDTWWIFATKGRGDIHTREKPKDCRRTPIRFAGYAISFKKGGFLKKKRSEDKPVRDPKMRAHVRIDKPQLREIEAYLLEMAPRWSVERLEKEFRSFPFEPYGPIKGEVWRLRKKVNKRRLRALKPIIGEECFWEWAWRVPVKPFG